MFKPPELPASADRSPRRDVKPPAERYAALAKRIPIDEKQPPSPSAIRAPAVGNVFNAKDDPTLAGRVVAGFVYGKLIERPDARRREAREYIDLGKKTLEGFESAVEAWNRAAKKRGEAEFFLGVDRPPGATGFHLNGEGGFVTRPHLLHFSKSTTGWKDGGAPMVRAYLTLEAKASEMMQEHFVGLCGALYREGVDFTAKAGSPFGVETRTDNAIFYIAEYDREKAAKIIREFMTLNRLGKGTVEAAEPDVRQEGLSWAPEPDASEERYWQDVSGATTKASHNVVVASRIVPDVLERLAQAHRKNGDAAAAETFAREALRVRRLRESLESGRDE